MRVRIHLTNVSGAGASHLLQSLLPAMERDSKFIVQKIYLPNRGLLSEYQSLSSSSVIVKRKRSLPNALSRLIECTLAASEYDGDIPLLVLGDLPLRSTGPQTIFIQQSNLLAPVKYRLGPDAFKYWVARLVFRFNLRRVRSFIVQTVVMRDALVRIFPVEAERVHVIPQPPPSWLLNCKLHRNSRVSPINERLALIYPAANYPHKNHKLLSLIDRNTDVPVDKLLLTLDPKFNPASNLPWLHCCGFLTPNEMLNAYSKVDALLFLSKEESYGFPLIEAMFVGLPVVCPDLPYAHALCGDEAIYFDPDDSSSLLDALRDLQRRLQRGWWPNWKKCLMGIPKDWDSVARQFLEVACQR
jgi:glycosyltransferase involved in cell wall biosynthesis